MMIRGSTDDTKALTGQYSVNFGNFYNGKQVGVYPQWGFQTERTFQY